MKFKFVQMSSTNEERSLTSGIPIPQWMRSKTESYGFDPSTLSPPTHEGDFFYIKYPKPQPPAPAPPQPQQPQQPQLSLLSLNEVIEMKERTLNKQLDSGKQFAPKMQNAVRVVKPKVTKPRGIDGGFKVEETACGPSVVDVAHNMLAEKSKAARSLTRVDTEGNLAPQPPASSYLRIRRNSRSLPASPMTSPGGSPLTKRKNDSNQLSSSRLFGLNFLSTENNSGGDGEDDQEKKSGSSWILSSLFAGKDSGKEKKSVVAAAAAASADEEDAKDSMVKYKGIKGSGEKQGKGSNVAAALDAGLAAAVASPPKNSFFKSKPHLRDLNLLTPSSM